MLTNPTLRRSCLAALALALILAPGSASAHFLWITVEPASAAGVGAGAGGTVRLFLNELPMPGGPEFLPFVRGVTPTVQGQPLAATLGEETLEAPWAGKLPASIDAARDLGVRTRGGTSYRLRYTARAQTIPASSADRETADGLRVRLLERNGEGKEDGVVEVVFDGKPVPKARLKIYPEEGDPVERAADDQGRASIAGLAAGRSALWAVWGDGTPGQDQGKPFSETRHYASLTVVPTAAAAVPTAFAEMPGPAVNSFGGAVLGDWLYVYSGHVGRTHQYSVETTARHFRRLNLKDRATWEDLPMNRDVQGVALVTDGTFLYRVGGMSARNEPGQEHDLHSVADFARFDPASKTWTDLPPMPRPRSTHDAVVLGGKVYAVGGWTMRGATDEAEYCPDTVVFDLAKPGAGWSSIEQPFRRRALSAAVAGGKLYVLGGLNDHFKVERRVDVYDPATRAWSVGPDLPGSARNDGFGTSSFGVDGRVYQSGLSGRISRLDVEAGVWEAVGAWSLPRITHRLLPGPGHSLLAVGGNVKGRQTPVIERVELAGSGSQSLRSAD